MEIKNLKVRENKFYEAEVDGKFISFSYDGERIRGLWFDKKPAMALDTLRECMQSYNVAAEILKIEPIFKKEEIDPNIIKVSHEFVSDLVSGIEKINSAVGGMVLKLNQVK